MKMTRRKFVKTGLALGAATLVNTDRLGAALAATAPDIVAVKGADAFRNTLAAIDALGGMKRFVKKGSRVGLLVNAPAHWRLPGSHTDTDVVLAVAKLCLDQGAKELVTVRTLAPEFWRRTQLPASHAEVVQAVKDNGGKYLEKTIAKGVSLKKAMVIAELLEVDVLVNIPVAKHHKGTNFTGNLKNIMGGLHRDTNRFFHTGSGKDGYEDVEFMSQCIADANTLRRPDLCVVDAMSVLATNGPDGPGEILSAQKVVAGVDPVAVDAYCVTLHGRKPEDVVMLAKAAAHGIGRADLAKLSVRELAG